MKLTDKVMVGIKDKNNIWLLLIILLLSQGLYLLLSSARYRIGFPLDDAWIHQTYARNFAQTGVWAFNLDVPSGGSTSPLWSFLLIPGHLFRGSFFMAYTFFVSWLLLFFSAILFEKILDRIIPSTVEFPVFGALFLLEWHFIWAANSGMETILFVFFILLFFDQLLKKQFGWKLGLILAGVLWVRPDGLTLLGPLIFVVVFSPKHIKRNGALWGIILFLLSLGLYFFVNKSISGSIFPNTFYAKQAEYAVLYDKNILFRFWDMLKTQFVGYGVLLIPGLAYQLWVNLKNKNWLWFSIFLWWAGYLLLYALRLPVFYQHGRYQIPAISIYLMVSLPGCIELFRKMQSYGLKLVRTAWVMSGGVVLFIFVVMGADAYAVDVAIIESEMVNTALWIDEFTEPDALIAAHDIGALGFYGNRNIIDLAGLISPAVIPYMQDEAALIDFLNNQQPDYLMTFETWYRILPEGRTLVYTSNAQYSMQAGGDSMQVYIWEP